MHTPHRQQGDTHSEVPDGRLSGEAYRDPRVAGRVFQMPEVYW